VCLGQQWVHQSEDFRAVTYQRGIWALNTAGEVVRLESERSGRWNAYQGAGVALAVDTTGAPWVVTENGEIYYLERSDYTGLDRGGWAGMPGSAQDIATGEDGSVWVIGESGGAFRWEGFDRGWISKGGEARLITVHSSGMPWVVTGEGRIYRLTDTDTWEKIPGRATAIAAGPNGEIWVIGESGKLYRWSEDAWD